MKNLLQRLINSVRARGVIIRLVAAGVILLLLQISPIPRPAVDAVTQARTLAESGDPAGAVQAYAPALDYYPRASRLRVERALSALDAGDLPTAARDLESAAVLWPLSAQQRVWLGAAYLRQGMADSASAVWIDTEGLDATGLSALADEYITTQQWPEAAAALEGLSALAPDDARALYRLGIVQALDQPDRAAVTLAQAAALDPAIDGDAAPLRVALAERPGQPFDLVYARLGTIYLGLGEFELAETALTRAYAYNPAYAEALGYLAYCRAVLGRPALGAARQATALAPESPLVHTLAGLTWREIGHPREARAELEYAHDLDSLNPAIAVEIAGTHRDEGSFPWAEAWLMEAVRLAPGDIRFRILLAQFYVDEQYLVEEAGLPLALALVSEAPENAEAHDALGWAYFLTGDEVQAEAQLARALALDPELARAYFHMGAFFESRGEIVRAIPYYQRAAELEPHSRIGALARQILEDLQQP